MSGAINYRCPDCNSEWISALASAYWNVRAQGWEADVDGGTECRCEDCGTEFDKRDLDVVDVRDDQHRAMVEAHANEIVAWAWPKFSLVTKVNPGGKSELTMATNNGLALLLNRQPYREFLPAHPIQPVQPPVHIVEGVASQLTPFVNTADAFSST